MRAEEGRDRNGKVIRKGGRTSSVPERSGARRARAEFCFVSRASRGRSLRLCFCSRTATCSPPLRCRRPAPRGLTSQELCSSLAFYPSWVLPRALKRKRAPSSKFHPSIKVCKARVSGWEGQGQLLWGRIKVVENPLGHVLAETGIKNRAREHGSK